MYFKKLELVGFKSFYSKTVLHFEPGITAVVGPNGCGKCLHYDSWVTLSNGSNVKIGDLVERALETSSLKEKLDDGLMALDNPQNIHIFCLNPQTLKIETKPVHAFIKRKAPEYLLEIKTKSGKTVMTTHYHPFFSIKNGQIVELKAEELKIGARIAAARTLETIMANTEIDLISIFEKFRHEDRMYIPYSQELLEFMVSLKMSHSTFADISASFNLNQTVIKSALSGQAMNIANFAKILSARGISAVPGFVQCLKSRSCGQIILPRQINGAIAKILGYLISEGWTTKGNQSWFVNEDKNIVNDFILNAKAGFGVSAKVFNYKKSSKDVLIFSHALCQFMEKAFDLRIAGTSKEKSVPPQIFSCSKEVITEFLSALFEGDGYVCVDEQAKANGKTVYFEYTTASRDLAYGVSSLLLRLGVQSVIREKLKAATNTKKRKKRLYFSVYVYGLENAKRLAELLHFVGKKSQKLEMIKELNYKTNPNLDLIPGVNGLLKELVKMSGIKVKRFKKISSRLAAYCENRCLPSRRGLSNVLSLISEHGRLIGLTRSIFDYLKTLANSDIYWDEIVGIRKIYSEKWVYDLSVSGYHNFIAQDIIVHNSNIFDSIRWVLGEQSVKELRGSDMQDVIFNGTDVKEPLSLAEVTLTFDNGQRFFPVDHQELNITRRIFRSGESEYLLNKTQVRLKDILDLLMGTGIGAESYSLIQQGKIDLVLSSKPEDRRLVFDEASGITKYKTQKREAARKLEETEQNLLRVNDIITEVKRQIGSLERQANKARRYKEAFEELKLKEVILATLQKKSLEKEKEDNSGQLHALAAQESSLISAIQEQESGISKHQAELKSMEDGIHQIKSRIFSLENSTARNSEHIEFNREKIAELRGNEKHLKAQIEQTKNRMGLDEEKLNNVKSEHDAVRKSIEEREQLLKSKESQLNEIACGIKASLESIACGKKKILELAAAIAAVKNEISDSSAKQQILEARRKRLDIEKAKTFEEKTQAQDSLSSIEQELSGLQKAVEGLTLKITQIKKERDADSRSLDGLRADLDKLEHDKITLESQREFLEKLRSKYEDISESMNALVYTDKLPSEKTGGLVIKIKEEAKLNSQEKGMNQFANFKFSGEAKPIDLDTQNIIQKINRIIQKADILRKEIAQKETDIGRLDKMLLESQEVLRAQEINLVNKKSNHQAVLEQFNKIKEEEDLIGLELQDVSVQISALVEKLSRLSLDLGNLEHQQRTTDTAIHKEQSDIELKSKIKEETLVIITQTRTEREALSRRISSDKETLRILEDAYEQDKSTLLNLNRQLTDIDTKCGLLTSEIKELEAKIAQAKSEAQEQQGDLKEAQTAYEQASGASGDVVKKIESDRKQLDNIKSRLYELQMQAKDTDFKYLSIKDRILQAYKIDLDNCAGQFPIPEDSRQELLSEDIGKLKEKLDSYGTVNLVAIEEYDELKKRYDFLTQQHQDLTSAKESLHDAIAKINRTTKKMFLDTFEQVRVEFRNYFKLLFNGGDAQLFLIDEQDPLESGIEIICRPPGKKLQNVLLLSGGEKSMSAIALIFAIFKVKPAPFCVLDEIDAALDEANVDRYSRLLQEFAKESQFIVITHNKKTIANADIMYGITMEESGISKIVSVKFAKERQPQAVPVA